MSLIYVKCRHGVAMCAGTDPILECEDCALDDALCEFSERVTAELEALRAHHARCQREQPDNG